MIRKLRLLLLLLACFGMAKGQKLQSPSEFLGYKLGTRFTYHYRIVDYFRHVAQTSKNVKLLPYGTTTEGRPLMAAFVGSAENIARLEAIRKYNLSLAGLDKSIPITNPPVIVWLSYNVHGNEPACSEAAMETLYDMTNPANISNREWLKNTLIIIDPCLNPDGRERYISYYTQVSGAAPDANPASREHTEPWPGGRVNHYYFDLNRDWAWQVQKESQERVALYNQWLPQIHVDFHEQNYNSPYYFAPAAEPFHRAITPWQREFQTIIGKNNARYFDRNSWMYFTREEFDLLYPSYGDTYPLYNGAIGMTYEQGGISAGLVVLTQNGDSLTLADRITHHTATGLSTIETASKYAPKILTEYQRFFDNSRTDPSGEYKAYVIKNDNRDKMNTLAKLLDRNLIQYTFGQKATITGFNYFTGKTESAEVSPGDMVINTAQPKSVLLNVLFEPSTFMADSNTYDITAWSLPYVYGLKAYGLKEPVNISAPVKSIPGIIQTLKSTTAYAYVCAWQSVADARFLSALLKKNIRVRFAEDPFTGGGRQFNAGSLIITRAGNARADFDQVVKETAAQFNRELTPLATGFMDKGSDIGSKEVHVITKPRVLLLANEGTSYEAMGEVWHFFEQQIAYPLTVVNYRDMSRIKLADYNEIIMPDGDYPALATDKLDTWVRDGGRLIVMQHAIEQLRNRKGFAISVKYNGADDDNNKKENKSEEVKVYGDRGHDAIRLSVPGAIYKLKIDNTHPLGYGLPDFYYTLKLDDHIYNYLKTDGWNIGTIQKDGYVAGFVGRDIKEKISNGMLLGVQYLENGAVIYLADDPLFRGFWENGKLLFSNAVFMVGN
jgi:hypothetical protein